MGVLPTAIRIPEETSIKNLCGGRAKNFTKELIEFYIT